MKKCPQCGKELEDKVVECSCEYNFKLVEMTQDGIKTNLAQLDYYYKDEGIKKFEWSVASDEFICDYCKSKKGIYSYEEMKRIIKDAVNCKSHPCRCCFLPIVE